MRIAGSVHTLAASLLVLCVACKSSETTPDGGGNPGLCGAPCGTGLFCIQNADFPGAACTAPCVLDAGTGCPAGMVCAAQSTGNFCLRTCGATAPCAAGYSCSSTASGTVCVTTAAAASGGTSCPAPTLFVGTTPGPATDPGTCLNPRVTSALPAGAVQPLGIHETGTSLSFSVPAGAVGFSVVSQAVNVLSPIIVYQGLLIPNLPIPTPVLTPQGATFFDDLAATPDDLTTLLLVNDSPSAYVGALTFPNTTPGLALALDGGLPGGTWSLVVGDYARECLSIPGGCSDGGTGSNTYDVSVVVKPGPLQATGHMAADVYLVSDTLDAGAAVSNPTVQRFANQYATFFAQSGVCVSSITFHDVPDWARAKYASLSVDDASLPCSDFRQMMTLAEPGATMALFLVDELLAGGLVSGQQVIGRDGAIPGPSTFNGTVGGGAAVSMADLFNTAQCGVGFNPFCGPDEVAYVSGHETGHFLGLYHPTEQTGTFFDTLVDTPACVCALCELSSSARAACGDNPDGGFPTQVLPESCNQATQECGGSNLLMFWILDQTSVGKFTPEQAAVIRANSLVTSP
jgi:hypothetical protein